MKLLLQHVRDGFPPPQLAAYSEEQRVQHAALLIDQGLVNGKAIRGQSGTYVSTIMTELTSKGHDFLERINDMKTDSAQSNVPPELSESTKRFSSDHPDPNKVAFIMMRFGETSAHKDIVESLRSELAKHGITGLRADDKGYHDDLLSNILTYVYGCGFGIAVFERIEQDEFNPNVALEVGYMMALRKPLLLLKDRTLDNLHADLIGKLYKKFDPQNISKSVGPEVQRWLRDKGIIPSHL
jgi:hypothetical protein